MQNSCKNF